MDPTRQNGRPVRPAQTGQQSTAAPAPQTYSNGSRGSRGKKWLIPAIVVVVLLVAGALAWKFMGSTSGPKSDRYQAVFLDNGQVFFGKLRNTHGTYLKLDNAYYSKAQDLPADATDEQKAATSNNVSLVQVGDEVYGPEGNLSIRAEQVLFWQDLTTESKVSKAIDSAKKE